MVVNGVQGLAASDIPDLSSHYLPLSGGTITGGLTVTGSFSGGSLSLSSASSTNSFSTNATSTNLYASDLTLGTALSVANGGTGSTTLGGLLTGNGTGSVTAANVTGPLTLSGNTLAINQATFSQNGYLGSADFTTFENKISSTSLSAAAPLAYNSSTGAFSITQAGTGTSGYLSSGNWTTFNGKLGSSTIASLSPNYDTMWNGSTFANGAIYDNGTNVGIGTTTPGSNFSLQGGAGQAASLFNIASSTGASLFSIASNGNVTVATNCAGCDNSNFSNELPNFRLAVAKTRNGLQDTKILFIGDSTTKGIGSTLTSTFPTYGSYLQYIKLGSDTSVAQGLAMANLSNPDSRFVKGTGWTNYSGPFGFEHSAFTATAASGNLVFTPGSTQGTFDTFDVYYIRFSTGGNLSITATGSSTSLTVNTAGASAIMKATVTAGSAGINNSVSIVDTSGTVYVLGIEPYLSTKPSVRLGNAGAGGSTSGSWATADGGFGSEAAIQAYAPDLCVISLGINDATGSVAPATFSSNLQTVITACQASGDVVLMTMPPSTGSPYSTLEPQYVQAEYQLAQTDSLPVVDIYKRFGNTYNSNYMFDPYHPNQYGYQDWGAAVSQFLNSIVGSNYSNPLPNFSVVGQGKIDPFDVASSSGISELHITLGGNVGIGTSTPYSRLEVWGSDSASSTAAFTIANSASTTEFQIFDGGNAQLAGTLTQNSDQRLKTNIQSLDASSSLAAIDALNPVTFNWIDPTEGTTPQLGFIAQQVQQLFPALISTTSPTPLTPGGTLGLNYIGLISPIVSAIQALSTEVTSLEATVAGFASSFHTQQLCVGSTCINQQQLAGLLALETQQGQVQISAPTPPIVSGTTTPPSINIQGANHATINVGDTYTDLGAIVTDNQGHDLGYKTFLNGALVSNIIIDTSQVATDTIDYVVTDTWGNTATSTRTVIIEASPSIVPTDDATTTASSSPPVQ